MSSVNRENDSSADKSNVTAPVSATQRVYSELRQQIIRAAIAPGERLKVEALKVQLETGTTPIREALSLLTSDQLVERIDQRGFRAASASKAHFQEILLLRCQLEDIALRKSISDGDSAWEERLVLSHHRLSQASRDNTDEFEALHKAFHLALIDACGSPILLKFCDQLYDLNIRYRFLAGRSTGYAKRDVTKEHENILAAVIARDADNASGNLARHYITTGEFLTGQLGNSLDDH